MTVPRPLRRHWLGLLFLIGLLSSLNACQWLGIPNTLSSWASVEPLPAPELPAWITQVSPVGEAQPLSQILVRFQHPLIPLEALESPEQQALLQKFEIKPAITGQFRFLTPTMVGFQADQAIPQATRLQVTLKAGLGDLKQHRLEQDLAWTFSTDAIEISDLPGVVEGDESTPEPIALQPTLAFRSNVELDLESLRQQLALIPQGKDATVALDIALAKPEESPDPAQEFDPSQRTWQYELKPKYDLEKGTAYRLEIRAGVRPLQGNLPTAIAYRSEMSTYGPLALEGIEAYGKPDVGGTYGRFVNGSPQLKFNNPLLSKSVSEALSLTPAPKSEVPVFRAYDGDNLVTVNPWALQPNTDYKIQIKPTLQDGFGQTLTDATTLDYRTGDLAPDLWAPTGLSIFPAGLDLRLDLEAVNLPEGEYRANFQAVNPTDLVFVDSAFPNGEPTDLLPPSQTWQTFPVEKSPNKIQSLPIPLTEKLGAKTGLLAYGIRAKTNRYEQDGKPGYREPEFYGLVQLTNLGLFAQWFPESALVRVNHLDTGAPVVGARVELYRSQLEVKQRQTVRPCATAMTDRQGIARFSDENWQACLSSGKAPELLAIAKEGSDWAFTRSYEYSGTYEYGLDSEWPDGKPQSRGVIFSDRQLYQPGETVQLIGMAAYLQAGRLEQDRGALYDLSLTAPSGQVTKLGTFTTNEFGSFSSVVDLSEGQELGFYSLEAKAKNGLVLNGDFRVAEFKPPTFQVNLTLDRPIALAGQAIPIKSEGRYFFGSPVQGGRVQYYVTREKTEFVPPGWEDFSFGRQWFWPEEAPSADTDVYQAQAELNAQGQNQQELTLDADIPYPMTYRVEAQVKDISNLAVATSQTFTTLPGDRLIGLQSDFVGRAGEALPVKLIVTNAEGKILSGERVRLELQQMDYSSVTQLQEGSPIDRQQLNYKTVAQVEVTSKNQAQTVNLTPTSAGSYRLQANLIDGGNAFTATDVQVWVSGSGEVNWGSRYGDHRLNLTLDKSSYRVGDTATVLLESPYEEADLYLAVVRDRPLLEMLKTVQGKAPQLQFKITEAMLPNAAIEAVLVRRGQPIQGLEANKREKLVKIGFARFNIDLSDKYLSLDLKPQTQTLEPGKQQTLQLHLKNSQDQAVRGQITVMVVNDAVLQLSGHRPPDLVKTAYADQPITTRLADNRPDVRLAQPASTLAKGWGYGGGDSTGLADAQVRRNFQALAYYNDSVLTDAQGQAQVSFTLPDDLTTWRVMAVASDGDLHFGNAEKTFMTRKALVTNPLLPQFARLGDRLQGGVAVTNTEKKTGQLTLRGEVNDRLSLPEPATIETAAPVSSQAYRFAMVAQKIGTGTVQFNSQLGAARDAFEVSLPIKALTVTEQVVSSGASDQSVSIPLAFAKRAFGIAAQGGKLEISLSNNRLGDLLLPVQELLKTNQDFPFLETAATRLSLAASLKRLQSQGFKLSSPPDLSAIATEAIQTLTRLQQADGGFAPYPGSDKSDPVVTPYAARSLAQAQAEGFSVPKSLLTSLQKYLAKLLADPNAQKHCTTSVCKNQLRLGALTALADLGDRRSDFLGEILEQSADLDFGDRLMLARYLSTLPDWQADARKLSQTLASQLYESGRSTSVNLPENWRWYQSATRVQAEALQLGLAQKFSPERLARLAQGLLDQRRQELWPTAYDTAQALGALMAYDQTSTKNNNFAVTVQLGNKTLANHRFQAQRETNVIRLSSPDLPQGKTSLDLKKSGSGTLHYLIAYRYRLPGNQPGRLNGLRVSRLLRPVNDTAILAQQGLQLGKDVAVKAGEVFDLDLEIITDHPVHHLLITDPLPAGFEAIDNSFQTSSRYQQAQTSSWQLNYQHIHRDHISAYGDRLEAGVYHLHYLVRSVTPGRFEWPGAEVHLQYAPEEFGRSASSNLEVSE